MEKLRQAAKEVLRQARTITEDELLARIQEEAQMLSQLKAELDAAWEKRKTVAEATQGSFEAV